jgi:hypothetical protein
LYAPAILSARPIRRRLVGNDHLAVLLTDIESDSRIKYAHILVVYGRDRQTPIAYISSESARASADLTARLLGLTRLPESASHFLSAFTKLGHLNFGLSNDWADLDKFEAAALELVERLELLSAM